MGIVTAQIAKAELRAVGFPIEAALAAARAEAPPAEIATPTVLAQRHDFLRQTMPDLDAADRMFERIISGNELQDVAYLERGHRASRAVCRLRTRLTDGRISYGTGFLIAPQLVLTNFHVLPDAAGAAATTAEFDYELDVEGVERVPSRFALDPQAFFHNAPALDFAVVKIGAPLSGPVTDPTTFGFLPLVAATGKAAEGEWLTIVQHPGGERKKICVRENRLIGRTADALWYSTDTLGGSSGSPVFNNDWYVVALHHSGLAEHKDGRIQTIDGRDYVEGVDPESAIKWRANEGIRVSRIVEALRRAAPHNPLFGPDFGAETPAVTTAPIPKTPSKESSMIAERTIHVAITIDDAGRAQFVQTDNEQVGPVAAEAAIPDVFASEAHATPFANFDAPFDADYASRKGYLADFLGAGANAVPLPSMSDALEAEAAPLLKPVAGNKHVLHYRGMSVVMNARRRWALYSAANIDFANRFAMRRPTDVWRTDPRILAEHQVGEFYYTRNKFDRGHLTRREDMEYGATRVAALQQAADTCHFTNAVPQHARFNQNALLWQGLERHLLEDSISRESFRAQVFTGPILSEDDPVYARAPKIQYPVRFWKIAAAVTTKGKLFAAAFMLDQTDVIAQYGIEATESPFGPFKTFQVKISEIERLTGLTFRSGVDGKGLLSACDPLETAKPRLPRKRPDSFESTTMSPSPADYVTIGTLDDIVVPQ